MPPANHVSGESRPNPLGMINLATAYTAAISALFAAISSIPALVDMFGWPDVVPLGGARVDTTHFSLLMMILGFVVTCTSVKLRKFIGPLGRAEKNDKNVSSTAELTDFGFAILEQEVRIDLRKRKELGLDAILASELSESERLDRIVIEKVDPGTKEINMRHATSGHSIGPLEKPGNATWKKIVSPAASIWNPFCDILQGRKKFKDFLAKGGYMSSYYLTVPVSGSDAQEITYRLKYNNAFIGDEFEWAGEEFYADTESFTMHITFPPDKPFKSYEAFKKVGGMEDRVAIPDPEIETAPDKLRLTWKLHKARKGDLYFLKWVW
ncbi:MAG: hypothetical protein ABFS09_03225 [Thermodesulfobacteriota bacterium]